MLEPVVQLSLAFLTGPGSALGTESFQFFLEFFVVHGPVGLWFTMYLELWEEILISAFQDIKLGIVKAGVLIAHPVFFTDKATHSGPSFRGKFAVKD